MLKVSVRFLDSLGGMRMEVGLRSESVGWRTQCPIAFVFRHGEGGLLWSPGCCREYAGWRQGMNWFAMPGLAVGHWESAGALV